MKPNQKTKQPDGKPGLKKIGVITIQKLKIYGNKHQNTPTNIHQNTNKHTPEHQQTYTRTPTNIHQTPKIIVTAMENNIGKITININENTKNNQ